MHVSLVKKAKLTTYIIQYYFGIQHYSSQVIRYLKLHLELILSAKQLE